MIRKNNRKRTPLGNKTGQYLIRNVQANNVTVIIHASPIYDNHGFLHIYELDDFVCFEMSRIHLDTILSMANSEYHWTPNMSDFRVIYDDYSFNASGMSFEVNWAYAEKSLKYPITIRIKSLFKSVFNR